jgi:hypothetical protein
VRMDIMKVDWGQLFTFDIRAPALHGRVVATNFSRPTTFSRPCHRPY